VGYFSSVSYQDGRLWVSTEDDFHVEVEFNAVTGAFVKEIFSPLIPNSNQIVSAGADVFVVSDNPNDSVIEFNSNTRKLVRIIDRSNLGHGQGIKALLVDGSELWVANYTAGSVSFFRT
jgi:hypothetical protein